jgi:hypothetical protein
VAAIAQGILVAFFGAAEYIRVLGHIIKAVGTSALVSRNVIFEFILRNLEDGIE